MRILGTVGIRAYKVTNSFGKGCVRYSRPERIDFESVEALLIESEKTDAPNWTFPW
jgi:hypothetical protein